MPSRSSAQQVGSVDSPRRRIVRVVLVTACFTNLLFYVAFAGFATQQPPDKKVSFQVIVVDTESKARQALERLKKGEDFAVVAADLSIDPNAKSGGYITDAEVASLRPELREAVVALHAGEISSIVKVPTGFVILKLVQSSRGRHLSSHGPERRGTRHGARQRPSFGWQGCNSISRRRCRPGSRGYAVPKVSQTTRMGTGSPAGLRDKEAVSFAGHWSAARSAG